MSNFFHYTTGVTLKRVTSGGTHLRGLGLGNTAPKKCRGGVEPLATLCPISQTLESNPRPSAPLAMCVATKLIRFFSCIRILQDFIANHYKEDAGNYCDELADFADMRTATRTPSRTFDGVALLFEYYNQLLHIENRFFSPNKPLSIYFRW